MKISVALATYNGERYLREQLQSYLSQTRVPDELVVSDDLSQDNTLVILESFASTAPFPVKILRQTVRRGVFGNFAGAVRECSGDIIFFSDQDDIWLPHKISKLVRFFENNPSLLACASNSLQIDADGFPTGVNTWRDVSRMSEARLHCWQQDPLWIFMAYRGINSAHGLVISSELLSLAEPVEDEPRFSAIFRGYDTYCWVLAALLQKCQYCYEGLTLYRRHGQNTSRFDRQTNAEIANQDNPARYSSRLTQVRFAVAQLMQRGVAIDSLTAQRVEDLAKHYERAADARSRGFRGLPLLTWLVLTGSYWRHGKGFRGLAGDLLCCLRTKTSRRATA